MAAITICSDFGAQENKVWHCFHCFPIYFPWSDMFCHTVTWIRHGCTWVPNPEPPSHHPPYIIFLGHPSASAPSTLYLVSNLDWWFVSYMIVYVSKIRNASQICMSSLRRGHANLFCIVPILVYVLPKRALKMFFKGRDHNAKKVQSTLCY